MLSAQGTSYELLKKISRVKAFPWIILFLAGMLIPLGFAPFHMPGAALLGISLFYHQIQQSTLRQSFTQGLVFGLGFFGLGVSWISVSIHTYGHLALIFSDMITSVFIVYLALFPALCAMIFRVISPLQQSKTKKAILFSGLWCISEYMRAICMTGFPWLLLGFGQVGTPMQSILPILGVYGASFLFVLAACCLVHAIQKSKLHLGWLVGFVLILILPVSLKQVDWSRLNKTPLTVSVIQANLSMRDKWDETLFWKILEHYNEAIQPLLGHKHLIILPESAIPLPGSYVHDFLEDLHTKAKEAHSAVLFGIPKEANPEKTLFYNTLSTLGQASGTYRKQHLVPFGEYIPKYLERALSTLNLDLSDMRAGNGYQKLVTAHSYPFATLICYELAYPRILRQQLPTARWIVSLSDDGWFGHSLASYQHVQMAQTLSIMTGRYQIVANNNGLSSIITPQGILTQTLPAFSSGTLEGEIYPAQGSTPWIKWGDGPTLGLCGLVVFWEVLRRYSSKNWLSRYFSRNIKA